MSDNQKIENLEKDMIQLKSSVDYQSKILKEVKEILHEHKNILQSMLMVRESVESVKQEVSYLEKIFDDRKEVTDTNNKSFSDFVSKFKGGLAVAVFFFAVIQTSVGFVLSDNYDTQKKLQTQIIELKVENAVIKDRLKIERLDKTVQKAVESANDH